MVDVCSIAGRRVCSGCVAAPPPINIMRVILLLYYNILVPKTILGVMLF